MRKGTPDANVFVNWQDSMAAEEFLAPGKECRSSFFVSGFDGF